MDNQAARAIARATPHIRMQAQRDQLNDLIREIDTTFFAHDEEHGGTGSSVAQRVEFTVTRKWLADKRDALNRKIGEPEAIDAIRELPGVIDV